MICKKCGENNPLGSFVCSKCGAPMGIDQDSSAQSTQTAPASQDNSVMTCQKCHAEIKPGVKFCPSCGAKIDPPEPKAAEPEKTEPQQSKDEKNCPKCGSKIKAAAKFCPVCGGKADAPAEESKSEQAAQSEKDNKPEKTDSPAENAPAQAEAGITCACGNVLKPGAKFCPKCGSKVGDTEVKSEEKSSDSSTEENKQSASDKNETVCACGNVLKPGAKFCPKCGNKVGEASVSSSAQPQEKSDSVKGAESDTMPIPAPTTAPAATTVPAPATVPAAAPAVKKPLDKKVIGIIAGVGGVLLIGIIILIIVLNATPKINLSDYVKVEYEGYNGYGTVSTSFDTDKFRADWEGKLKFTSGDPSEIGSYLSYYSDPADVVLYSVKYSYEFDKTEKLKNGDTIKLSWNLGSTKEYLEKYIKVEVNDAETEYSVSELEEISSFDPFDGFQITYSGYNGNGKPDYTAKYTLSYEFDKTEGLKNGDKLHVSVSSPYGDDLAQYCAANIGAVPMTTSRDFTVEGLGDMESFDPFANVEVKFEGVSPNGTASVENNSGYDLRYSLDKEEGLKVGDKVVVTVTAPYGYDLTDYCEKNYEKKPSAAKKEYTVTELPSYVTKISEISEDILKTMKAESEDTIKSGITSEGESLEKMEYQGLVLLNLKDGKESKNSWSASGDHDHMLYLIYKNTVKVKNYDDKTISYTYWTFCRFNNITFTKDGTCTVDTEEVVVPNDSVSPKDASYYYKGYEKYENLFANIVTAKLSDYKYETQMAGSQATPQTSETSGGQSSSQTSETSSEQSQASAQTSETSQQTSETSAQTSETSVQTSETSKQQSSKPAA